MQKQQKQLAKLVTAASLLVFSSAFATSVGTKSEVTYHFKNHSDHKIQFQFSYTPTQKANQHKNTTKNVTVRLGAHTDKKLNISDMKSMHINYRFYHLNDNGKVSGQPTHCNVRFQWHNQMNHSKANIDIHDQQCSAKFTV